MAMAQKIHSLIRHRGRAARRLFRDSRGMALTEFAVVAPIFALFLLSMADLAMGFAQRFALQQAAARTLEMAVLGTGAADYSYLVPQAAAAAGVTEQNVTLEKWLECDGTRKAWDETCSTTEQIAKYVKITINSSFDPIFSSAAYPNVRSDGTVPISSHASLRIQ